MLVLLDRSTALSSCAACAGLTPMNAPAASALSVAVVAVRRIERAVRFMDPPGSWRDDRRRIPIHGPTSQPCCVSGLVVAAPVIVKTAARRSLQPDHRGTDGTAAGPRCSPVAQRTR